MLHVYHGNNVGHPLYPRTAGQTLTYIMTSRSTSLELEFQLTINLDPGWECQSLPSQENTKRRKIPNPRKGEDTKRKENSQTKKGRIHKKERKFPMKEWEKAKKRKKNSRSRIGRKRNMQKGLWTRQYLNSTELSPSNQEKGNHDPKWSSPFDCQQKSCASVDCSPHTKQNQKRKRPRTLKATFPTRKWIIPKKKSYWSMIMHVVFDLIGNDFQNQVMTYLWFEIRMKYLPVCDWYILSDFLLFLLDPVFPLNRRLETKY